MLVLRMPISGWKQKALYHCTKSQWIFLNPFRFCSLPCIREGKPSIFLPYLPTLLTHILSCNPQPTNKPTHQTTTPLSSASSPPLPHHSPQPTQTLSCTFFNPYTRTNSRFAAQLFEKDSVVGVGDAWQLQTFPVPCLASNGCQPMSLMGLTAVWSTSGHTLIWSREDPGDTQGGSRRMEGRQWIPRRPGEWHSVVIYNPEPSVYQIRNPSFVWQLEIRLAKSCYVSITWGYNASLEDEWFSPPLDSPLARPLSRLVKEWILTESDITKKSKNELSLWVTFFSSLV